MEPMKMMAAPLAERLRSLAYAAERAPHYREAFAAADLRPERIRDEEGWARVPFTTKEDLRRAYPFRMLAVPPMELAMILESSGTSGEPTASYLSAADLEDCYLRVLRSAIGLRRGDRVLVKTPYCMLSTAHQMQGAAALAGACVLPADNRTEMMTYRRLVRIIRDYRPTVLYCLPIELLRVARKAAALGISPPVDLPWVRGCLVNGEMLSEGKRRFLSDLIGARVYQDYGSTETTSLAAECEEGRLHLNEDRFFFEVRLPAAAACAAQGRGELVVTSLRREAMPLVRYAIGDHVEVSPSSCPCGSRAREVTVWGRMDDEIRCQGRRFFPIELEDRVYTGLRGLPPVFFRAEYDEARLVISLETQDRDLGGLRARIPALRRDLAEALGVEATVQALPEGGLGPLSAVGSEESERPSQKPAYVRRLSP
jgi:phenylacetate-CoA ligase